jgi:ribosomal protein L44E
MESANFSTAKLDEVDDRYYLGVSCQSCMRSARLSLTRLRGLLGDGFPVVKVRTRLKCSTCGSKELTVTFLAPHQAVGNLASLFKEPAR